MRKFQTTHKCISLWNYHFCRTRFFPFLLTNERTPPSSDIICRKNNRLESKFGEKSVAELAHKIHFRYMSARQAKTTTKQKKSIQKCVFYQEGWTDCKKKREKKNIIPSKFVRYSKVISSYHFSFVMLFGTFCSKTVHCWWMCVSYLQHCFIMFLCSFPLFAK